MATRFLAEAGLLEPFLEQGHRPSPGIVSAWGSAASPLIDGKNVFVCGGGNGQTFIAFDKESGKVAWKTGNEQITHASPTIATANVPSGGTPRAPTNIPPAPVSRSRVMIRGFVSVR